MKKCMPHQPILVHTIATTNTFHMAIKKQFYVSNNVEVWNKFYNISRQKLDLLNFLTKRLLQ